MTGTARAFLMVMAGFGDVCGPERSRAYMLALAALFRKMSAQERSVTRRAFGIEHPWLRLLDGMP